MMTCIAACVGLLPAAVKAQVEAEHAAAESLALVRRGYDLGASSYLALLNAQQTYQQAVINLAQARTNRYADTAALFQALGGGWWERTAAATPGVAAASSAATAS
jgi:outer membrane protein TolC